MPTGVLKLKHEVVYQPDCVLKDKYPNLVHSTTLNFGGHYAGLEVPELLAEELFKATQKFLLFHRYRKERKNPLKYLKL